MKQGNARHLVYDYIITTTTKSSSEDRYPQVMKYYSRKAQVVAAPLLEFKIHEQVLLSNSHQLQLVKGPGKLGMREGAYPVSQSQQQSSACRRQVETPAGRCL